MTERKYSATAVATTVTVGISSGTTTVQVAAVTGWPTTYPFTVILDEDQATEEVIEVTSASTTTLTVTRGVDGTSAQAHSSGATARHGFSARDFREPQQHIAASTDVHGVSGGGSVVGTNTAQTLTNKTLTSPTINSGTIVTPTIASFTNATHDHSNAAGGGNIPQASVTGLVSDLSAKAVATTVATDISTAVSTHAGLTATHGVSGAVVGTTDTQSLTNKTLGISTVFPAPQGKDLIMNGAMHVWQRGTSISVPAATRTFTADRWAVTATGAAMTASPTSWAGTSHARPVLALVSSGAVTAVDVTQRIPHEELAGTYGSQAYTLSFYVYQSTGSAITPQVLVNTANALDNFSAVTNRIAATNTQSVSSGGYGTTVYYTFTPSLLTNFDNGIEIVLRFGAVASTQQVWIGSVTCTPGSAQPSAPLPTASYGETLVNCQRFYQQIGPYGTGTAIANGANQSTTAADFVIPLPVTMRRAPDVTFSANNDFTVMQGGVAHKSTTGMSVVTGADGAASTRVLDVRATTSGLTTGYGCKLTNEADTTNAAIYVDAEL